MLPRQGIGQQAHHPCGDAAAAEVAVGPHVHDIGVAHAIGQSAGLADNALAQPGETTTALFSKERRSSSGVRPLSKSSAVRSSFSRAQLTAAMSWA